jgi:hypothetical protein
MAYQDSLARFSSIGMPQQAPMAINPVPAAASQVAMNPPQTGGGLGGFVGSLGKAIVDPFIKMGSTLTEGIGAYGALASRPIWDTNEYNQTLSAALSKQNKGEQLSDLEQRVVDYETDFYDATKEGKSITGASEMYDKFKGQAAGTEFQRLGQVNPIAEGVRQGATVGSYFMPGSLGLKGALAAGALSGVGQTEDLSDIEDLSKNVVTGMGTAGLTYGAIKGLGGLGTKLKSRAGNKILSESDEFFKSYPGIAKNKEPVSRAFDYISMQYGDDAPMMAKKAHQLANALPDNHPYKSTANSMASMYDDVGGKTNFLTRSGQNLQTSGQTQKVGGLQKVLGKPTPRQGGLNLLRKANKIDGIDLTSPESAMKTSEFVSKSKSNILQNQLDEMAGSGKGAIPKSNIDDWFNSQMDEAVLGQDKQTIQRVYNELSQDFMGAGDDLIDDAIPINKWYRIKQAVGPKGKWNDLSPTQEKSTAQVYEKLYAFMNDQMDDSLKASGFSNFRQSNADVATATKLNNFLTSQANRGNINLPIGLMDVTFGGAGLVAGGGNPLTAGAAMLASKALRSPTTQMKAGGAMQQVGRGLSAVGQRVPATPPINVQVPAGLSSQLQTSIPGIVAGLNDDNIQPMTPSDSGIAPADGGGELTSEDMELARQFDELYASDIAGPQGIQAPPMQYQGFMGGGIPMQQPMMMAPPPQPMSPSMQRFANI